MSILYSLESAYFENNDLDNKYLEEMWIICINDKAKRIAYRINMLLVISESQQS